MLEGRQQDEKTSTGMQALRECLETVITVSGRSCLMRTLGQTYPNSHMRYKCDLRIVVSGSHFDVSSQNLVRRHTERPSWSEISRS